MKLVTLLKILILFVSISSNSCRQDYTSERPHKTTLPLPDVTIENNHLKEWSGQETMSNSVRAWHYNPAMVQPLWDVGEALAQSPLNSKIKLMLATVTASRNYCPYCLSNTVCLLIQLGISKDLIEDLQTDIINSGFTDKEKALLLLAEQITLEPSFAHKLIGPALKAGWTEAEVAQAIFITSYFNMLNRISEAFAFPPDEEHPFDPNTSFPITSCETSK